ncbi:DUF1385 domain-containing protein [Heliophilum fasciatum]|uniref:Uncharacterized protein YqhQ n=1 Tax=Heliophilum fasciatum TaxID=35700 RepID=A0A4V2SX82_9FIRM|nr:DUF1385 domain-containing protein [Heliophilum fasciatum]MCW2277493.1 uncharacterized protein YqhQ [Heliophilum fasciatum]TCP65216.1 uncharacterized protein YqhQ [Heliophilum fasciatum]
MGNFTYGGQAVIEGVMMRGPDEMAIAVRRPDASIVVQRQPIASWLNASWLMKTPILRGTGALIDALVLGIKALSFSASQQGEDEEEQLSSTEIAVTIAIAMLAGAFLFIVVPTSAAHLVRAWVPNLFLQNLLEGIVRIGVFFAYILLMARMPEIQRVFQYHGAEHKVIHAHEAGVELTVDNAQRYTTEHPRCGTSFLLFVMVLKILVFSLLPDAALAMKVLFRLALVPLVAGISYELIKLSGKYPAMGLVRLFILPGLWLQRLTTREPDDQQVEVAIHALQAVRR